MLGWRSRNIRALLNISSSVIIATDMSSYVDVARIFILNRSKYVYRWTSLWFGRISPFSGIWDTSLFFLALLFGCGVALLADGGRLGSTPLAHWVSQGNLTESDSSSVFNSIGIWMSVFSSIGLVAFFMAYPPRPWRISPYRLRIFVIVSMVAFALGTTLWFNGDSLASVDAIQSRIPGDPNDIELAIYFDFLSIIIGIVAIISLWSIWVSRQKSRIPNVSYGFTLSRLSPVEMAQKILVFFVIIFVLLAGFHWFNGSRLTDAPSMVFKDFRVAAKCPQKPATVLRFIQRSPLESWAVDFGAKLDKSWVQEICEDLLDDL